MPSTIRFPALALLALFTFASSASAADSLQADAKTKRLLQRAEFEQVVLSPNGELLAFARRMPKGTIVTINRVSDLEVVRSIDPGKNGEVGTVQWLDETRLVVGANWSSGTYGVAFGDPSLYIVPVAPQGEVISLPENFVAAIDGDPDHLLVSRCNYDSGSCIVEIRKALIGRLYRRGEPQTTGPATHATLLTDRKGKVHFAISWADDGTSKTWVLGSDGKTWAEINDEAKTGLVVYPMGLAGDGKSAFLQAERSEGTDVVESYDFATGKRTDLLRDASSDPLWYIVSTDTQEPIGAYYNATRPRMQFWNPQHPQAKLLTDLQKLFPTKFVALTSASRDYSKVVFQVSGDTDPGTFYFLDRKANKARVLTKSHPWVEPATLATSREITLTARDGLPLRGVLSLPPGAVEKNLPLVVLVHGGPYGVMDTFSYDTETQIIAQQGYAVLQVNFRGSGGAGKAFLNKGMRQWGKAMQDDVTDATQWAIKQGIADPKRVCIFGSSYGAYSAMMGAIREPDLYRCAAGYAGVYDLNKMYKWDNLRRSDLGLDYLKRALGTDKADLEAHSPAAQAGRIKANVFLAHGRLDSIADFRFARAMEKSINRAKGQKVDLIEYSYQGHGIRLAEQREDFYARLLQFLHANLDGVSQ